MFTVCRMKPGEEQTLMYYKVEEVQPTVLLADFAKRIGAFQCEGLYHSKDEAEAARALAAEGDVEEEGFARSSAMRPK
jgi:hypothetical protein